MLEDLEAMSHTRHERERIARQPVADRSRGPAVATSVDGVAEVAALLDRHLSQCRRHRSLLAVVCVSVDCVDTESGQGVVPSDTERAAHLEVLNRICSRVRGSDVVLRPNDRDACVILPGASEEAARRIAGRLLRALNGAYRIDDQVLQVNVQVGSAAHPADGSLAPELLRRATGW
jgi:GGDEF domain-containing protein